jgi:hypothetical protein
VWSPKTSGPRRNLKPGFTTITNQLHKQLRLYVFGIQLRHEIKDRDQSKRAAHAHFTSNEVEYFLRGVGRVMAQAVSRWPLTAEARVRSRFSPCGISGGKNGTGTGFSPSTSGFPCQFHSTGAPLLGKMKKTDHLSLYHRVAQ